MITLGTVVSESHEIVHPFLWRHQVGMADPAPDAGAAGGGAPAKSERPLGPDGKPIPGPEQMRQIQAERKMKQQQAQVEEVIGIMHKNVENV